MSDERRGYYLRIAGVDTPMPETGHPFMDDHSAATPIEAGSLPLIANIITLSDEAATCRRCRRHKSRSHVLFGKGNSKADILFVGSMPDVEEDFAGEPFVSRTGRLFDQMLLALGLERSDIYLTLLLKCRSEGSQKPISDEVEACKQWLQAQVHAISPKVICLFGQDAARAVLASDAPLGALRHHWHEYENTQTLVTYHPLELLHSPARKEEAWRDLRKMISTIEAR